VTEQTVLKISFPVADEAFGALASPSDLDQMRITSDYGWVVQPHLDGTQPFWVIKIPAGRPISGSLTFNNVISHLEEGFAPMMLHWEAVPGCEDGEYRLPMYKFGPPGFLEGSVIFAGGPGSWTTVYWNTENASRVIVEMNQVTFCDDGGPSGHTKQMIDDSFVQTIVISGIPFGRDTSNNAPVELFRRTLKEYFPCTYYLP
jgi:hypothetical protein